jgi:YYY domain-containing protein
MAILGNLGTIKMVLLGFQRLAAPGVTLEEAGVVTRVLWSFEGLIETFKGASLPYSLGDWYWLPSRIIPAPNEIEPITEFPFFTVLYADPHAHLFALPLALLAISFALSVVLAHGRWESWLSTVTGLVLGGLVIGVLFPVNTWDFPTYLVLGAICLGYALWRSMKDDTWREKIPILKQIPRTFQGILLVITGVGILFGLALLLFKPYTDWYALGYSDISLWQGTRTPLHAYLLHWGLFLFLIVSWLTWETIDWMANTPVSSLQKVKKYRDLILVIAIVLLLVIIGIGIKLPEFTGLPFGNGINIAWLVLPLAAWTGLLILRVNQPDAKRFVLFMVGTGLILTLMVEIIVLTGDAARMNTVFKFYLQVWTLFSISAAASLGWLVPKLPGWSSRWRTVWQVIFILLVAGTAMYPLMATRAKIEDRMAIEAPLTLDGMEFMKYATYLDEWGEMDLSQDYEAIRWLQENVEGSPTIVEANLRNLYRWGSRYSIYTGLPGIVGWEWHQQQQRSLFPGSWVTERIFEVDEIYQTSDPARALEILRKYNVQFIILGQQERGHYAGPGLDKFEEQDGILWDEVFRFKNTVIYQIRNSRSTTSISGDDS